MSRWLLFVSGVLSGLVLAVGGVYLYYRDFYTLVAHSPYVSAASQARLDIAVLRKLKAGDLGGAAELMEWRLKLNETTLNGYTQAFPSDEQDELVTAGLRYVEQYRKE
jgi:hypothetical protein